MSAHVRIVATLVAAALWAGAATGAAAGSIDVFVRDADGKPVTDAVVSAVALSGPSAAPRTGRAIVDQVNREFVPHVRPVMAGTAITFPNKDELRHHVYSFSPAKRFELPLYKGTEAPPVTFDKPGVVVLGCNIHDWMLGYVYVLETPYFDSTAATGRARIADLAPRTYDVRVWQPRMTDGAAPASQRVTITAGKDERIEFVVSLKPDVRPRRAPSAAGTKYR